MRTVAIALLLASSAFAQVKANLLYLGMDSSSCNTYGTPASGWTCTNYVSTAGKFGNGLDATTAGRIFNVNASLFNQQRGSDTQWLDVDVAAGNGTFPTSWSEVESGQVSNQPSLGVKTHVVRQTASSTEFTNIGVTASSGNLNALVSMANAETRYEPDQYVYIRNSDTAALNNTTQGWRVISLAGCDGNGVNCTGFNIRLQTGGTDLVPAGNYSRGTDPDLELQGMGFVQYEYKWGETGTSAKKQVFKVTSGPMLFTGAYDFLVHTWQGLLHRFWLNAVEVTGTNYTDNNFAKSIPAAQRGGVSGARRVLVGKPASATQTVSIDEWAVYNFPLNQAEIDALYAAIASGPVTPTGAHGMKAGVVWDPAGRQVAAWADAGNDYYDTVTRFRVTVYNSSTSGVVHVGYLANPINGYDEGALYVDSYKKPGTYHAKIETLNSVDTVLDTYTSPSITLPNEDWFDTPYGTRPVGTVPYGFTAITRRGRIVDLGNGRSLDLQGKSYGLPNQILSNGAALLDRAVDLEWTISGNVQSIIDRRILWITNTAQRADWAGEGYVNGTGCSRCVKVEVRGYIEYDGNSHYVMNFTAVGSVTLSALDLFIRMPSDRAKWVMGRTNISSFGVGGSWMTYVPTHSSEGAATPHLYKIPEHPSTDTATAGTGMPHDTGVRIMTQIQLSDYDRGIEIYHEGAKGWVIDEGTIVQQIDRMNDTTVRYRARLANKSSTFTGTKTIEFGITVAPTKSLPSYWRAGNFGTVLATSNFPSTYRLRWLFQNDSNWPSFQLSPVSVKTFYDSNAFARDTQLQKTCAFYNATIFEPGKGYTFGGTSINGVFIPGSSYVGKTNEHTKAGSDLWLANLNRTLTCNLEGCGGVTPNKAGTDCIYVDEMYNAGGSDTLAPGYAYVYKDDGTRWVAIPIRQMRQTFAGIRNMMEEKDAAGLGPIPQGGIWMNCGTPANLAITATSHADICMQLEQNLFNPASTTLQVSTGTGFTQMSLSGTTATMAWTNHGFAKTSMSATASKVEIASHDDADCNGVYSLLSSGYNANQFQFTVPATCTGGPWTPAGSPNLRIHNVFQQVVVTGTQVDITVKSHAFAAGNRLTFDPRVATSHCLTNAAGEYALLAANILDANTVRITAPNLSGCNGTYNASTTPTMRLHFALLDYTQYLWRGLQGEWEPKPYKISWTADSTTVSNEPGSSATATGSGNWDMKPGDYIRIDSGAAQGLIRRVSSVNVGAGTAVMVATFGGTESGASWSLLDASRGTDTIRSMGIAYGAAVLGKKWGFVPASIDRILTGILNQTEESLTSIPPSIFYRMYRSTWGANMVHDSIQMIEDSGATAPYAIKGDFGIDNSTVTFKGYWEQSDVVPQNTTTVKASYYTRSSNTTALIILHNFGVAQYRGKVKINYKALGFTNPPTILNRACETMVYASNACTGAWGNAVPLSASDEIDLDLLPLERSDFIALKLQ